MTTKNNKDKKISKELRKLVITRLETMPTNFKLSIGSETLTKEKMIKHIQKGDKIGNQIVGIQLNFIKALTTGKLLETLNTIS